MITPGEAMVANASYSSLDLNNTGVDLFPTNRYTSILVLPWVVQVTETTISTSEVCIECYTSPLLVNIQWITAAVDGDDIDIIIKVVWTKFNIRKLKNNSLKHGSVSRYNPTI